MIDWDDYLDWLEVRVDWLAGAVRTSDGEAQTLYSAHHERALGALEVARNYESVTRVLNNGGLVQVFEG